MLTALYKGKIIFIEKTPSSVLREASEKRELHCPDCNEKILFKECASKQNHFSHFNSDCSFPFREAETIEHESGKLFLYHWLQNQFVEEDCKIERKIHETNQRADTFVESLKTAVEFQCSPIQAKTWKKRNDLYKEAGVNDLWILGYSMHSYPNKINTLVHKLNSLEESMIEHHGKIIYFDVLTKQFIFLYPQKKIKGGTIGVEFFLRSDEVYLKNNRITSKYDYFLSSQEKRRSFLETETTKADNTKKMIKEIKSKVDVSKKVLATKNQKNYIQFLLKNSGKTIPYKLDGLLVEEASELIKSLKEKTRG